MGDWLQDRCNSIQKAQQEHIQKSFGEDIEKARSGVYKPTKQNLKEGKAGQKYGHEKKEENKIFNKVENNKDKSYSEKINEAKSLFPKNAFNISSNKKGFRATSKTGEHDKGMRMDSRSADNIYKKIKELGLEWKGSGSHFSWSVDIK